MTRLADEFNAIPWNARGRKIGHSLQIIGAFTGIMFGPTLMIGLANWLVP